MKCIAVIPARGGSKRIPNKNIKNFLGEPIISYSIRTAIESKCFEDVFVSTDSNAIRRVANKYGAKTPFVRSAKLSDDFTDTLSVLKDAITRLESILEFDSVCCLYATAPLLRKEFLEEAKAIILKKNENYVVPVAEYQHPIQRSFMLSEDSMIKPENQQMLKERTQDLARYFHDTGQFYFGHKDNFLQGKPLISSNSKGLIIPKQYVCDIDTEDDWRLAESLYRANIA